MLYRLTCKALEETCLWCCSYQHWRQFQCMIDSPSSWHRDLQPHLHIQWCLRKDNTFCCCYYYICSFSRKRRRGRGREKNKIKIREREKVKERERERLSYRRTSVQAPMRDPQKRKLKLKLKTKFVKDTYSSVILKQESLPVLLYITPTAAARRWRGVLPWESSRSWRHDICRGKMTKKRKEFIYTAAGDMVKIKVLAPKGKKWKHD